MSSTGRPIFDLNEPPAEEDEENDGVQCVQPQKLLPSNPSPNIVIPSDVDYQPVANNQTFSHASSGSGFQPFVRVKDEKIQKDDHSQEISSSHVSCTGESKGTQLAKSGFHDAQNSEREEGEWSYMEGGNEGVASNSGELQNKVGVSEEGKIQEGDSLHVDSEHTKDDVPKIHDSPTPASSRLELEFHGNSNNSENTVKEDTPLDEASSVLKPRDIKGLEGSQSLKCPSNPGKRNKIDQHKEAMLGKKRARQTVFLNLEDIKQAGPIKNTPRRQNSLSSLGTRALRESRSFSVPSERGWEKQDSSVTKDTRQNDEGGNSGNSSVDLCDRSTDSSLDANQAIQARGKKQTGSSYSCSDYPPPPPVLRQGSWKQVGELRQAKDQSNQSRKLVSIGQSREFASPKSESKKFPFPKKPCNNTPYQDTSVERLLREVTNDKFWHHPEETELQCIPGRFESVEEYIKVFEPLLFEECRAQLYSTWDELTETVGKDVHTMVRVKHVEKRERGWYDVICLPVHECKWTFKEGDVAVLSVPRPGSAKVKRINTAAMDDEDDESTVTGRVAGTVRRHMPIDTRDPHGAILHFYVGDAYDYKCSNKAEDDHVLLKLQMKGIWYLTVLGSLATTQREYIALHAFRRLNVQMQTAILKPSPEQFPKYEEQTPSMPDCFTQNFVDYLHKTFNGPQLAAIQWAAMHTAAGTSNSGPRRQDPWPFTLVQGPPGTGKTHTVWGMLNVIHLVQYQHYYTALLRKLAPESYKQANDSVLDGSTCGSIDDVLQSMDQNLFRTLPKLCPKPRMLVCAPSNAATDELLARVLDRGFIDGEMKVYRPDVARVGVDSQSRAAQAVSVERRTEQLLLKGREEILGWMHQLKAREAQLSQQIAALQRELSMAALAGRTQGSVGVDPDVLVARDHSRDVLLQNLAAIVEGRDKVLVEMSRLLILEARFRAGNNFNLEEARSNLEASFANEAEIVFTTVSSSGRKLFSRLSHGFDMVVIDEAAQASEVAVLPPLSLGAARCVLVGDPQQLPATVISKAAGMLLYSRSLFERFQQAGCPTMLLSVQYRMHPQIRDFPSRYFYQGRLTDSESVAKLQDEVYYKDPLLRPYIFYDIMYGRESHRGGSVSYQNVHEAQFCLRLYEHLRKVLQSFGVAMKISVGIITPYKLQLKCLQREFEDVLSSEDGRDLYINTVDAFQGQERDVIIMSCVRASHHGVGFVADIRRMNVALTRARRALWVIGNANALIQSDDWAALISDARARSCFVDMDSLPKELLVPKIPSAQPVVSCKTGARGVRFASSRYGRQFDMLPSESRSHVEEDKSYPFMLRNGNHWNSVEVEEMELSKRRQISGTAPKKE